MPDALGDIYKKDVWCNKEGDVAGKDEHDTRMEKEALTPGQRFEPEARDFAGIFFLGRREDVLAAVVIIAGAEATDRDLRERLTPLSVGRRSSSKAAGFSNASPSYSAGGGTQKLIGGKPSYQFRVISIIMLARCF